MFKMALSIQHDKLSRHLALDTHVYDWELDDIRSVLWNICTALNERSATRFHVEGFGDSDWPIDVQCDLAILVEQLPAMLKWLKSPALGNCSIKFYEQAVQRELVVSKSAELLEVECVSSTKWTPQPKIERVQPEMFLGMCTDILKTFMSAAKMVCPDTTENVVFKEWQAS